LTPTTLFALALARRGVDTITDALTTRARQYFNVAKIIPAGQELHVVVGPKSTKEKR